MMVDTFIFNFVMMIEVCCQIVTWETLFAVFLTFFVVRSASSSESLADRRWPLLVENLMIKECSLNMGRVGYTMGKA